MTDLTGHLFKFNELRRHLWNAWFAKEIGSIMDPKVDVFFEIQKLLFKSFVLIPLGKGEYDLLGFGSKPIEFIEININNDIDQIKILKADRSQGKQWEEQTIRPIDYDGKKLLFVDFFDWYPQDPQGRTSYEFVEVQSGHERWLIDHSNITASFISQTN